MKTITDLINSSWGTTETNETTNDEQKSGSAGLELGVHFTKDDSLLKQDQLKISVIPPVKPKGSKRAPAVVCCVVDTSGSMGSEAVIKDTNGKTESHGLSILDLVKHSIKTIIHCLADTDYLSIVSYSSKAKVELGLIKMTKNGRKQALKALDGLYQSGQTNLWDGLFNGLEVLRKSKEIQCDMHNSAVLLFTDGMPNITPPKGEVGMLEKYMDTNVNIPTINTYGFGYSLDTKLLNNLAIRGNGAYAFIPDSSFVGTIFVNSICNFCCNVAKNTVVKVETARKVRVMGNYEHQLTSWGVQINLGNVMYGQSKNVILQFEQAEAKDNDDDNHTNEPLNEQNEGQSDDQQNKAMYDVSVQSLNYVSLTANKYMKEATKCFDDDVDGKQTQIHYYRLLACDVLRECMDCMKINDMDKAQKKLKNLMTAIRNNKKIAKDKFIIGLLEDLSGQCFEAMSKKEYYDKWGKHYIPSLIFAHLHEFNNNFKDPGVQNYGGAMFDELRDKANDIFIKLPPPKPSRQVKSYAYGGGYVGAKKGKAKAYKPVNMKNYYNASGGCFHGDCKVLMNDGSMKMVKDLRAKDVVYGGAMIQCVVKHKCKENKIVLSNVNGLLITNYHPILINNVWRFPIDVGVNETIECEYVFNFVLSHGHALKVEGVDCCTLGHELKDNEVIEHAYFGTNKVIDDLQKVSGWKTGVVTLKDDVFERDEMSQMVQGMAV